MPWHVGSSDECPSGKPHAVLKDDDGSVAGCHETREQAEEQVKALYANEDDMAVDFSQDSMVAVFPSAEEAEAISREGGQDVESLHVTLAFLPDGVEDIEGLSALLTEVAAGFSQLAGSVGGIGHFTEGDDGIPVIALPDVDGLSELRQAAVAAVDQAGVTRARNHGWTPHLTLEYANGDGPNLDPSVLGNPLTFTALSLVVGDERYDFPLEAEMKTDSGFTIDFTTDTAGDTAAFSSSVLPAGTWTFAPTAAPVEAEDVEEDVGLVQWEGILAVEGYPTNDGRMLMVGEMGERELPLPLMAQTVTSEGHAGAELAGRIDEIWRVPNDEYGDGAVEVWGRGVFDTNEVGRETARQVEAGMLTGVSVDTDPTGFAMLDPETLEEVDPETLELEDALFGGYIMGLKGSYMGATLTAFPAIEHASISILSVSRENVVVASAFCSRVVRLAALTAAAKGMAPLKPPTEWFHQSEADRPTPLTVTPDGRVFGHLAAWGTCHTGISGVCRMAPRSRSGYAYFHLGQVETNEGEMISVGKLTVDTDHADTSPRLTPERVRAHYDNTGTVVAFVRATDGRYGIWLSGAVRSDASPEAVRNLMAYPPSGDWRAENGGLELQATLAVVVPGYPVPRYELAMVASGQDEGQIAVMIQTGFVEEPPGLKESRRRTAALSKRARSLLVKQ